MKAYLSRKKRDLYTDPENVQIFADPLIEKVIYNLIDNSLRYGEHLTEMKFYSIRSGEDLLIICQDNGIGIPPYMKEKIFFQGIGQNTGLGHFLSREIHSTTNVTIQETAMHGEGARFEMRIPRECLKIDLSANCI